MCKHGCCLRNYRTHSIVGNPRRLASQERHTRAHANMIDRTSVHYEKTARSRDTHDIKRLRRIYESWTHTHFEKQVQTIPNMIPHKSANTTLNIYHILAKMQPSRRLTKRDMNAKTRTDDNATDIERTHSQHLSEIHRCRRQYVSSTRRLADTTIHSQARINIPNTNADIINTYIVSISS